MHEYLSVAPDVADALARRQPVVALESTVIAHGMPHPRNLETAQALEALVRDEGAVPATVAVLDGRIRIGLTGDDLERLATGGGAIGKLSRRDLPVALATRADGATTVAATMIAARLAGIAVFATGGIGGVHRGAETSFDISADLDELARTDVCVVCAGAKSILDLPKTLEYLETRGVPVLGFGTDTFPAFYARSSGLPVARRCDSADEVARILHAKWRLGLGGGVLATVPVPEDAAIGSEEAEAAIARALEDAARDGVGGKAVTPYLLARIKDLTDGRSLDANIALIANNARHAARIATAYAHLQRDGALPPRAPAPRFRP